MSTTPEEADGKTVQITGRPSEPDVGDAPNVEVQAQTDTEYRVGLKDHRGSGVVHGPRLSPGDGLNSPSQHLGARDTERGRKPVQLRSLRTVEINLYRFADAVRTGFGRIHRD